MSGPRGRPYHSPGQGDASSGDAALGLETTTHDRALKGPLTGMKSFTAFGEAGVHQPAHPDPLEPTAAHMLRVISFGSALTLIAMPIRVLLGPLEPRGRWPKRTVVCSRVDRLKS